jgi:hypothetical protein
LTRQSSLSAAKRSLDGRVFARATEVLFVAQLGGAYLMPNLHRGEIEAELGGRPMRLVLTLGALAELEAAFDAEDLVALAERFESGRLSSRDAIRILGAGLRGAGSDLSDEEVARLSCPGAAAGYMRVVARLLAATFGATDETGSGGPAPARP